MLQLFHMNVAKVDRGMLHMLQVFQGMLQAFIQNVSSIFRRMLQPF
jgi:hypothetical protein